MCVFKVRPAPRGLAQRNGGERQVEHGLDKQGKVVGQFEFTGVQPYCVKRFEELGISFDIRSLLHEVPAGTTKW